MTVPDPLSVPCELAKHSACDGDAYDLLRDEVTACSCPCHRGGRK